MSFIIRIYNNPTYTRINSKNRLNPNTNMDMTSFNFFKIKFTGKGKKMNEVNLIRIQNSIFTSSNSRVRTFRYSLSSWRKFLLTFTLLTQISEIQVQSNFEDKVSESIRFSSWFNEWHSNKIQNRWMENLHDYNQQE